MKRRSNSGAAYFEAQGRRCASLRLPMNYGRAERCRWPKWAREAWARGFIWQMPNKLKGGEA